MIWWCILKKCTVCLTLKSFSEFNKQTRFEDGLARKCRACASDYARLWYSKNPDKAKVYAKNKSQYPEYEKQRWAKRKYSKYGLTEESYQKILEDQGGVCAICKQVPALGFRTDHDHVSGQVRGLLCLHCNTGLGHFVDSVDRLKAAIDYLER